MPATAVLHLLTIIMYCIYSAVGIQFIVVCHMTAVTACCSGATETGVMGCVGEQEHEFRCGAGISRKPAQTSGNRKT